MAVHDAAYSAVARLRGEHDSLGTSEFRYIPYAPAEDATGYYTTICPRTSIIDKTRMF